jgi:hypothetical protein
MPLYLARKVKELEAEKREILAELEEVKAKRDEIFFWYLDYCERIRDGGFVKLPPPDLRIVERSQTHVQPLEMREEGATDN